MYDKIYEKISIKDDDSIKSFEELLGINMDSIIDDIDKED